MPATKCGFDDSQAGSGAYMLAAMGPTLIVNIGFDATYDQNQPQNLPAAGIVGVHALVDTGASESCIDNDLAIRLGLPAVDRRQIAGVGGAHTVNMYLAQIHIPTLAFTVTGMFSGVHLTAGGPLHVALIGRTFLQHFNMTYEGTTGTVIISTP